MKAARRAALKKWKNGELSAEHKSSFEKDMQSALLGMPNGLSSFVFYSVARSLGRSLACSIGRSLGRSVARSLKGVREAQCILLSPLSLETRSAVAKAALWQPARL